MIRSIFELFKFTLSFLSSLYFRAIYIVPVLFLLDLIKIELNSKNIENLRECTLASGARI